MLSHKQHPSLDSDGRLPRQKGTNRSGFGASDQLKTSLSSYLILAFGLCMLAETAQAADVCHASCATCFSFNDANACMSCPVLVPLTNSKKMHNFACITACPTGYANDLTDYICKRTKMDVQNPCAPTTFERYGGAAASAQCTACPAGSYCDSWALEAQNGLCLAGHFCLANSASRSPVAAYGLGAGASPLSNALSNKNRYIFAAHGDICKMGYYCVQGSSASLGAPCKGGEYCPDDWSKQSNGGYPFDNVDKKCNAGYFCSSKATKPTPGGPFDSLFAVNNAKTLTDAASCTGANSGAYTSNTYEGAEINKKCTEPDLSYGGFCPVGNWCALGSTTPTKCSATTFLPHRGAKVIGDCQSCIQGNYCPTTGLSYPTGMCDAGYFCSSGSSNPQNARCSTDHECPRGTVTEVPCAEGKFTPGSGAVACTTCNAGAYCTGTGGQTPCPAGRYCNNDRQMPCAAGSYSLVTSLGAEADCDGSTAAKHPCEKGFACYPIGNKITCSPGYICLDGATTPRPIRSEHKGKMCIPGEYCPSGSFAATLCQAGFFCSQYKALSQVGQCWAGALCPNQGTTLPYISSNECPPGSYCTLGAIVATPCPAGTYSASRGAVQESDCSKCPAGVICTALGQVTLPVARCAGGYHCPKGTSNATLVACAKGYKCPAGVVNQIYCEAGTYQDLTQQETCKPCPVGKYCDGNDPTAFKTCPRGFYCLLNTKFGGQYPCLEGYYSSATGVTAASGCTKCNKGFYCQHKGTMQQSTKILARYHANKIDGQFKPDRFICPQAHYCPEGAYTTDGASTASQAIPCVDGKWTASLGNAKVDDCIPCERGTFCAFTTQAANAAYKAWYEGSTLTNRASWTLAQLRNPTAGTLVGFTGHATFSGPCDAGYICKEGANRKDPTVVATHGGYECPIGHFCPIGALIEIPCLPGTYQDVVKQPLCKNCPAGSRCNTFGMTAHIPCDAGMYCPVYPSGDAKVGQQVGIDGVPCPAGTYISTTLSTNVANTLDQGLSKSLVTQCMDCPATMFCEKVGQLDPTDVCAKGFVCIAGKNDRPGPYATTYVSTISSGKCPTGFKCESGDTAPSNCLAGTVQETDQQDNCLVCPPGFYCAGGQIPKQPCDEGYFCKIKASVPKPVDATGGICPALHECASNTGIPLKCKDGFWNTLTGQGKCGVCPNGSLCATKRKTLCPLHRVCDGNSTFTYGHLCDNGYYASDTAGMSTSGNCTSCPSTQFCMASQIVGKCAPGYICIEQADTHKPNIPSKAYACPKGSYCPEGTEAPIRCPLRLYTFQEGAKQLSECTDCKAGYYCNYDQLEPKICPQGAYCPIGSMEPTYCSRGTFNPIEKKGNKADCLPCKGGYHCSERGLGNLVKYKNKYKCPSGHYCPRGEDIDPIKCIAGSYLDASSDNRQGQTIGSQSGADTIKDCDFCPEHFFCPKGTGDPFNYPCPAGSLCPLGSPAAVACPPGYYCPRKGTTTEKIICPAGNYCPVGSDIYHKCDPGKVCNEGSASEFASAMTPCDCPKGSFLNVDKCLPCMPGFVCSGCTSEKYPLVLKTEGGYACPPGHYCPGGAGKEIKCPAGSSRLQTRGETIADCKPCTGGSAQNLAGQMTCVKCGRGAQANKTKTICECKGQFRTWQASTNACVCRKGYMGNDKTMPQLTSTSDLDCKPIMAPVCATFQFKDIKNQCQNKSSCVAAKLCDGKGVKDGYFDSALIGCFCKNQPSDPADFCDSNCEKKALKAFITTKGSIILQADNKQQEYAIEDFDDKIYLDGYTCNDKVAVEGKCEIQATSEVKGKLVTTAQADQVFVDAWSESNVYDSPYPELGALAVDAVDSGRRLNETDVLPRFNETDILPRRRLQGSSKPMLGGIICIKEFGSVSFKVSSTVYPVYREESIYNTDPNYDYGLFTKLATKLTTANLNIKSFIASFTVEGVFVFGNVNNPDEAQTIVKVVKKITDCKGQKLYPTTPENLQLLSIVPKGKSMARFNGFTQAITPLFIIIAFAALYAQHFIEKRIEDREAIRRAQHMGISAKYFKKKDSDKFDKMEYYSDLYKLIEENLEQIQREIENNERLEQEDGKENMRAMVKDRYSVVQMLKKSTGNDDFKAIQDQLYDLLNNLKFSDGRSLQDVLEARRQKELLEQEEARLAELEANKGEMEGISEHSSEDEFQKDDDDAASAATGARFAPQDDDEDDSHAHLNIDSSLVEDLIKAKEELRSKRDQFISSMDDQLSESEKADLLAKFDDQMREMERSLKKQMEDQDQALQNKMAARKKKRQEAQNAVNDKVQEKQDKINEIQDSIQKQQIENDELGEGDINSRALKKQRDKEFKEKMVEFDGANDEKLNNVRQEYMKRIEGVSSLSDKERLLEEMGRRLKSIEDQFTDDRKRQESNLMKQLRARQNKKIARDDAKQQKEIEKKEEVIEEIQAEIDIEKAKVYAEQGTTNLVDQAILSRMERVANKACAKGSNFDSEHTKQESEDIEIHKAQLLMEKAKQLQMADHAIEEEIEIENNMEKEKLDDEAKKLRRTIQGEDDPDKRAQLMAELEYKEKLITQGIDNELKAQDRILQEKLARKKYLMSIRKLKIERDQLKDVNDKEIEMNQKKFDQQITGITKKGNDELDKQLRNTMTHNVTGNEKGLILIDQAHDALCDRKLQILMSKQFFELSKYIGTLQSQIALDRMIRVKEIEDMINKKKDKLIKTLQGNALDDALAKLQAEKQLELSLVEDKLKLKQLEEDSAIRVKQEKTFGEEKKDLQRHCQMLKKDKLKEVMELFKEEPLVLEIGAKMIKRIDATLDDQMKEIDDQTEKKLEEARLRIVAENEEELAQLQNNLDLAMEKEAAKVEVQMNQRRDEVLQRKKENMAERLNMIAGEMTADQVKEMRAQMEREYDTLEKAISEEKKSQLQKMRGAMLQRRIAKERRRKEEIRAKEEDQRRKNIQKMNAGLAKAFSKMIHQRQEQDKMNNIQRRGSIIGAGNKLKSLLVQWKKGVDNTHIYRDQDVLNMDTPEMKKKREAEELAAKQKAELEAQNASGDKYTIEELYKKILKVEKLSDIVKANNVNSRTNF